MWGLSASSTRRRAVVGLILVATIAAGGLRPVVIASPQVTPNVPVASSARDVLAREITMLLGSPGLARATWGIAVRSLATGESMFAHNPNALLVPASVAKLATLASTVDAVGWDFTFDTTLRATGPVVDGVLQGDLIVVGSGDPSIGGRGGAGFASWIDALRQAGITRIEGRVIGDDDAIDEPRPGAMWAWDDLGYTSGALFGALNYAENRLLVTVRPGNSVATPTSLSVSSEAQDRPLLNRSITGAPGSDALIWPEQRPGETALTIAGSLPAGSAPVRLFVSAGDPTRWFVSVLRREILRAGIEVTGPATDIDELSPKPDTSAARVVYYHSPPLADIARPLLKESINLYSEAVFRMSTGLTGGRTNDDALAALKARLLAWGLPPDGLQVVDGSGLSRRDGIAADTLVAVLARMYDPTWTSPWMTSLPVAGRDGSLETRMRGTAAESRLRAKTGTMSNIRSLAGYVHSRDGEPLAFAIIVNNFEGTGREAQATIDAVAVKLAEFRR